MLWREKSLNPAENRTLIINHPADCLSLYQMSYHSSNTRSVCNSLWLTRYVQVTVITECESVHAHLQEFLENYPPPPELRSTGWMWPTKRIQCSLQCYLNIIKNFNACHTMCIESISGTRKSGFIQRCQLHGPSIYIYHCSLPTAGHDKSSGTRPKFKQNLAPNYAPQSRRMGSWGIAPYILNLGITWSQVVSFTP
jgi:hypothetical protein